MIGLDALTTFSGVLAALATYLTIMGKRFAGGVTYVIVGAGGLAVLWERWSERTGEPAHFSAFLSPVAPISNDIFLMVTHFPVLCVGIYLLYIETRRIERS